MGLVLLPLIILSWAKVQEDVFWEASQLVSEPFSLWYTLDTYTVPVTVLQCSLLPPGHQNHSGTGEQNLLSLSAPQEPSARLAQWSWVSRSASWASFLPPSLAVESLSRSEAGRLGTLSAGTEPCGDRAQLRTSHRKGGCTPSFPPCPQAAANRNQQS